MNTFARIATAASVVVAAVIGVGVIARSQQDAGPAAPTTPPARTGSPSLLSSRDLEPGTYGVGVWFPVQFELTISDKWETWDAGEDLVRIWKPVTTAPGTHSAILTFEIVSNTFTDPCRAVLGPRIGEGVDDLVNALTSLPGFQAGPVMNVTVGGHAAKSFDLDKSAGSDRGTCVDGGDWLWVSNGPVRFGQGAHQRIIVLNVDGTRLLIDAITYSGDEREMDAIIDSIRFAP